MAEELDQPPLKDVYRKLITDGETSPVFRKYSFTSFRDRMLSNPDASGEVADFLIQRGIIKDREEWKHDWLEPSVPKAPKPVAQQAPSRPVQVPPLLQPAQPSQGPSLTQVTGQQAMMPMAPEPQFQPFQFQNEKEIQQAAKSPVFLANKPAMQVMADREQMAEANPLTWRQNEATGKYGVFEKDAPINSKPLAEFDNMNQAAAAIKTRGAASNALIMPTKEAEQEFGEMSPQDQQMAIEGSTGGKEYQAAEAEKKKSLFQKGFESASNFAGGFNRAIAKAPSDIVQTIDIISRKIWEPVLGKTGPSTAGELATKYEKFLNESDFAKEYIGNPEDESLSGSVGSGLGQIATMIGGGGAARRGIGAFKGVLGLGEGAALANKTKVWSEVGKKILSPESLMSFGQVFNSEYQGMKAKGESDEVAFNQGLVNAFATAPLENLPIANLAERFQKLIGAPLAARVVNALIQGGEEGSQEVVQQIFSNLSNNQFAQLESSLKDWSDGLSQSASAGGIVGGLLGAIAGVKAGRVRGKQAPSQLGGIPTQPVSEKITENPEVQSLIKDDVDRLKEYIKEYADENKSRNALGRAVDKFGNFITFDVLNSEKQYKKKLELLEKDPIAYYENEIKEREAFYKKYPEELEGDTIEYKNRWDRDSLNAIKSILQKQTPVTENAPAFTPEVPVAPVAPTADQELAQINARLNQIEFEEKDGAIGSTEPGERKRLKNRKAELEAQIKPTEAANVVQSETQTEEQLVQAQESAKEKLNFFNERGQKVTGKEAFEFLDSLPEGTIIQHEGGETRTIIGKKIISSRGSETFELIPQILNEETGQWENNPSAVKIVQKDKNGEFNNNAEFTEDFKKNAYTDSNGNRIITTPTITFPQSKVTNESQPATEYVTATPEELEAYRNGTLTDQDRIAGIENDAMAIEQGAQTLEDLPDDPNYREMVKLKLAENQAAATSQQTSETAPLPAAEEATTQQGAEEVSRNQELDNVVRNIPIEDVRRPNGAIGTQGFTSTQLKDLIKFINTNLNLGISEDLFNGEKLKPLIDYIKNSPDLVQKIQDYVKKDPIEISIMPDDTIIINDGNHRANLLNLIGSDVLPTIEAAQRNQVDEINAKYDALQSNEAPAAAAPIPEATTETGGTTTDVGTQPVVDESGRPVVEGENVPAAPAAAPLAGTTFKTAKGSVYTYLPDGRTQRFKTATNEQNEPQDLTVFVKFKDAEQEQDFLEGIQRSERFGTKVYLIDQQGNKYDTNEQAAGKDVRLVLVKDGKVIDTVETSLTPQIGYNTFDQRRFKKDGENYREAHLGNKVTEINPASETTPNQSNAQQIAAKEQAEGKAAEAPKAGSLRDVELTMRRPEKNEVIFVPIDALLEKQAADQPSYDIQKEDNRIKGRVEKAKEFLKNYLKDQRAINPKTGKRTNAKVSFEPSVVDIDADGKISFEDGRHRVLAAKELGLTEVPIEVPKGKGKAIQESLKQKTTETKGKESPKTIDRKATQALLDQANDELAAAKSAFDKKKAELNKTTKEDAPDLFGKRKVESGQGLFEMPRINPAQREKAIQPFRDRFEKAKAEVNRLTTLLNEGQEVTQELKFESDEQVQTTGTEVRKGKGATKNESVVRKKTPPVRNAGRTPDAIAARNVQFFGDPYYSSLQYVMDMTYHPDLLQAIFGGPDKNAKSGRKNIEGERKSRIQFLDKKSNIKTADRLGELLAEKYAEDNNISVREAEEKHNFRDIAETIILNHNSRNQMVKAILDQNDMVENQYKFQYDPEGIYGEDFNEDAAKDIDNSLDDIPDSYWEGMDLTDEQYNELFAPDEPTPSPLTAFQTKGEAGRKAREALKEEVGPEEFRRMDNIHRNGEKMLRALEGKGILEIRCP